jgi:hypothetical protein
VPGDPASPRGTEALKSTRARIPKRWAFWRPAEPPAGTTGERVGAPGTSPTDATANPEPPRPVTPDDAKTGPDNANKTGANRVDATATGATKTGATRVDVTKAAAKADGAEIDGTKADGAADATKADGAVVVEEKPKTAEERWANFAAAKESPPSRFRRIVAVVGRGARHEYTVAILAGIVLAVVATWPALRYPQYTIPLDVWDPVLQSWQMAWTGHALLTDPLNVWNTNAFFPERNTLAYSDSLLGYAPAGMIGSGPEAALVRYNIIYVLAHALCFVGMYFLARQLGARRIGAAVAGLAFTYAPWRLAQEGHLNIISSGGIPLALAMLARGHGYSFRHGYRPERRHLGWVVAGWWVAAWQVSLGFGLGLPFTYVLIGIVLVAGVSYGVHRLWIWKTPKPVGGRLLAANLSGGLVFTAVGVLMSLPYFAVVEQYPNAQRSMEYIALFSPPFSGLFIAPDDSLIWGDSHAVARESLGWAPEMTLLPGFVLYALALFGLAVSIFKARIRIYLLAGVVVSAALALGTQAWGDGQYTYALLFEYLPGWNGIRTPSRLVMWTTLLLALLAAGAVSEFERRADGLAATRIPSWPGPWLRLATLVPLLLVAAEGTNRMEYPVVPSQPAAMRTIDGPMLVLPTTELGDMHVMLWSTTRFQQIANGSSGFAPPGMEEIRKGTEAFPDVPSIELLRQRGIRTVVLLRDQVAGTPWERAGDVPIDGLGIQREDLPDAVVFRL